MDKDRKTIGNHPRSSIDGFVVNRRGRTVNTTFNSPLKTHHQRDKHKNIRTAARLQSSPEIVTQNMSSINPNNTDRARLALSSPVYSKSLPNGPRPRRRPAPGKIDKKPRSKKKKIVLRTLAVLASLLLIVAGYLGYKFAHDIDKVFGGNIASNLASLLGTTRLKGENQGRVNILLAGDSADDPNHPGAQLTDSIMIVSINTKNNTAFLLSIPRDLYVKIPDWSLTSTPYQKINAANEVTNFNQPGYPYGGMGDLEKVIQTQLGIPIDYYALIDYTAFRDAVNAVGGITIDLQTNDPRGIFDPNISKVDGGPLKLPNGWITLNGQTALNLARSRGDPCYCGQYAYGVGTDFDRTQHQRQMLIALEQKARSIGVLTNPIKVGQLFDALGNNVQTDLSLADVLRLTHFKINNAQSESYPYGGPNSLLTSYLTPDGQDALVPTAGVGNFSQLQLFYQKLVSNNPIVQESANVVVLNGGSISGLASQYKSYLFTKGVNVSSIADAPKIYNQTVIIDNSGGKKPATKALLSQIFGNNFISNDPNINTTNADFVVILGQNQGYPPKS